MLVMAGSRAWQRQQGKIIGDSAFMHFDINGNAATV
jgi:hypothetical protein